MPATDGFDLMPTGVIWRVRDGERAEMASEFWRVDTLEHFANRESDPLNEITDDEPQHTVKVHTTTVILFNGDTMTLAQAKELRKQLDDAIRVAEPHIPAEHPAQVTEPQYIRDNDGDVWERQECPVQMYWNASYGTRTREYIEENFRIAEEW